MVAEINPSVSKQFSKDMGRLEFLAYLGAGVLAISGVSGLKKVLSGTRRHSGGYSSGSYGGRGR